MALLSEKFKLSFAQPKTKIQIGKWTAVILAAGASLRILILLLLARDHFADRLVLHGLVKPIVLSNLLDIVLLAAFAITVSLRLLKTAIILFAYLVFLVAWNYFSIPYPPLSQTVFQFAVVFWLWQGLFGVYRQTYMTVE